MEKKDFLKLSDEIAKGKELSESEQADVNAHTQEFAAKVEALSVEYGCSLIPHQNLTIQVGARKE